MRERAKEREVLEEICVRWGVAGHVGGPPSYALSQSPSASSPAAQPASSPVVYVEAALL